MHYDASQVSGGSIRRETYKYIGESGKRKEAGAGGTYNKCYRDLMLTRNSAYTCQEVKVRRELPKRKHNIRNNF